MHLEMLEETVVNWVSLWFRCVDDAFTLFNNNNGSKSVSLLLKNNKKIGIRRRISLSFLLTWRQKRSYTPVVPSKTNPNSRPNDRRLHPFSGQNGAKLIPFGRGAAHMAYKEVHSPHPLGLVQS